MESGNLTPEDIVLLKGLCKCSASGMNKCGGNMGSGIKMALTVWEVTKGFIEVIFDLNFEQSVSGLLPREA